MLWTEKYSPKNFDEVLGNVKIKDAIVEWTEEWLKGNHPEMHTSHRPSRHG